MALDNLDDSSFRDMNYYPRDLIDYSRKHGWIEEFKKAVTETDLRVENYNPTTS
ncbi:hypothetical protein [Desulfovibrio litoralis]|uniref:hypothetical protein n=1 Tax=Desulfovibrio litoralis TaxID=466107 RepID=UPI0015BB6890|nr:hypothetical protein [Desulfovibrio litoralis]